MAVNTTKFAARGASPKSASARKASSRAVGRHPSDDEILGLVTAVAPRAGSENYEDSEENASSSSQAQNPVEAPGQSSPSATREGNPPAEDVSVPKPAPVPAELAPILAAHPLLREAWDSVHEYQQVFATPAAARDAQQQLADLDSMFFSPQPADHAALAARIHELSPEAFHGLTRAMQAHATKIAGAASSQQAPAPPSQPPAPSAQEVSSSGTPDAVAPMNAAPATAPESSKATVAQTASDPQRAAQTAFFHDTNAAAVEQILGAIQSQVDRLLPDSVGAGTRNRIIGEIYRELDAALRANHQLARQLREAFQSGSGDTAHQGAIVTLITGRARQALPAVAKRVIGEWTQSILAANRERLGRHEAASKRVDIAGAGPSDGVNRRPISPREINYRKLSDADILNL